MNKLITKLEETSNVSQTHNGAKSLASSLNACVDLFGSLGAMRARSDDQVISAFSKAFAEDKLTAMRILFYVRDIRGGQGERKVFRTIIKYLADVHTEYLRKNLNLIETYGRWDDFYVLEGTKLWGDVVEIFKIQLGKDLETETPSLLGKWLKSSNTSSKESRRLARKLYTDLGWSEKTYRKTLSDLRRKIDVVEKRMCENEWSSIQYSHVPSRAAMIYRNAFKKHDERRYQNYLDDVASGKQEIKAATLYPYDLIRNVYSGNYNQTVALQWDNLPNYVEPFNGLVIYDTSGSMGSCSYYGGTSGQVRPIDVAISLAIYIAERNEGEWKNCAIPFATDARFEKFKGSNIYEKFRNLNKDGYWGSTNLQSAFDLILNTAVKNKISADDMPKTLFIVSDMQFNQACDSNKRSNFEQIEKKYRKAGYERPNVVFWNVNAYGNDAPVKFDENGTALISGCSPAILKTVLSGEVLTPVDLMNQAVHCERYQKVQV